MGIAELSAHISTIKRGHYGLLDVHVKLAILRELVAQALESDLFKEKLDEDIDKRQALAAARRDEALEEGRKRREEKERLKIQSSGKDAVNGHGNLVDPLNGKKNGDAPKKGKGGSSLLKRSSDDRFYIYYSRLLNCFPIGWSMILVFAFISNFFLSLSL